MNLTIDEIIDGLITGRYSREQAIAWIDAHIDAVPDGLRDHFAGLAMSSVMAHNPATGQCAQVSDFPECAKCAYAMADAMLEARVPA